MAKQKNRVEILDTTLRDGVQGEGVSFSREDKLKVIRALDRLGVDYIEAGNPASNPKDREFFEYAREHLPLSRALLTAFGSTRRVGTKAGADDALRALRECGAPVISLFGKASRFQAERVLRTTAEENLNMIADSVRFLADGGRRVLFDAEHFFDGYLQDRRYALLTLRAAADAGAELLVLCDTNGGALPGQIEMITREVVNAFEIPVAIHCHNDSGVATAATLIAVEAGATHVQGTINGYGERCGNANLNEVIPNLVLKMGRECLYENALALLTPTARLISEIANLAMDERAPYVGRSAFAHKGGMHIDGMLKDDRAFEHVDPALVGNRRHFLVSEVAGRGALMTRLRLIAPELGKHSGETGEIVNVIKNLESEGYSFEGADGSLTLRALDVLGRRREFFEVLDFHIVSRKSESEKNAQAYVKVKVNEEIEIAADEGDGPVNALDLALRKALTRFFPSLSRMRLKDFKVRVVDSKGTASTVRVHIDSTDGEHLWSTVGVSGNIIEASFIALMDSIDYMLWGEIEGWPDAEA